MVETGETPEEVEDSEIEQFNLGQPVFDADGNRMGKIRGFEQSGFFVTLREGYEGLSVQHARSGQSFGEAELMWRCTNCGEMGEIDEGIPDTCPSCDAPREELYYWTED